jgi:hypothetical protein
MASLRKRYQNRSETNNDAPVTTAPTAAKLPEPITEQAAPEPNPADEKPSAVEQAEKDAIKKRIAELERAEDLQSAALDQQVRFARERQRQVANVPEHIRRWAEENPRYVSDPIGQAELNVAILKAQRDGKNWQDPDFIEVTERHLGLRQQAERPVVTREPSQRQPVQRQQPVRQQASRGPAVSAPPTREVPSMTTGRPVSDVRLSEEESRFARSLGLSESEYLEQKIKMKRLQAAGALQDGRQ